MRIITHHYQNIFIPMLFLVDEIIIIKVFISNVMIDQLLELEDRKVH